jgi:GAF domain-containing protein
MTHLTDNSERQPDLSSLFSAAGDRASDRISRALQAVRTHLGLQVGYISRFEDDHAVVREVDPPGLEHFLKTGDRHPLNDGYCHHILEGRLPELIPDTSAEPLAMAMAITEAASIGSHLSVPIRLPDGDAYGMFCCIGFSADRSLNERDLQTLKVFADIAAFEINREHEAEHAINTKRDRI